MYIKKWLTPAHCLKDDFFLTYCLCMFHYQMILECNNDIECLYIKISLINHKVRTPLHTTSFEIIVFKHLYSINILGPPVHINIFI